MSRCAPGVRALPFFSPAGGEGGFIPPPSFGPLGAPLISGGPGVQSFWSSRAVFSESVTPVLTLSPAFSLQEALHTTQAALGDGPTPTGDVVGNQIDIVTDQVRLGTNGNNIFSALRITHNFGGGNTSGARETLNVIAQMTAPSLITNPNPQYVAATIEMQGATSDNNVGGFFGLNPRCLIAPGLGALNEATGYETDMLVGAGSAPVRKFGGNVYSLNGDLSHGTTWDAAYGIGATGTGVGWLNGLLAHVAGGTPPIATTGALVATQGSYVIDRGVDLSSLSSVTTALLQGPGSAFRIDGNGNIRLPNTRAVRWRNAANSADINDISTNASNQLTLVSTGALVINGVAAGIVTVGPVTPLIDATYDLGSTSTRYANAFFSGAVRLGTIELGNPSDTTLARVSAGDMSIEGNLVYRAGGTDVPITDGGTGASTVSGARTNLGLGTAAVEATGTSGHTLPFLDGSNTWSGVQTHSATLRMANNIQIVGRNAANNADLTIAYIDASNNLILGTGAASAAVVNNFVPVPDNTWSCGANGVRWTAVWAVNGTIQTSDLALKHVLGKLPTCLQAVEEIEPIRYRWKEGKDKTVHWGFAAQHVEKAMRRTGCEFGGIVRDDGGQYNMAAHELIPVLWKAVQELAAEVKRLRRWAGYLSGRGGQVTNS